MAIHQESSLNKQAAARIASGGVAVIPTDTIYGIVSRADSQQALTRIRKLKQRSDDQAFMVLCANVKQIEEFSGIAERVLNDIGEKYWPGKYTIIFKPVKKHPLVQGDPNELSFRIPDEPELRKLLEQTGPLVAPSANPKGMEPAKNIAEARAYFGDQVDLYVDGGEITNVKPSKVIKIHPDGSEEILRA